ncbi:MAG TPA: phage holin family protein [Solirubrobacteraceae bacterium]|nr:phage holin family protein [Solirubrobacteraceae bacterium]
MDDSGNRRTGDPQADGSFAQPVAWHPTSPRFRPLRLTVSLLVGAVSVWVTGLVLPGVHVKSAAGALLTAALIGVMNALLPPIVAALRLPFTLALGFLGVLAVDAGILLLVSAIDPNDFQVDSFGWALGAALVMSAASLALQVILGVNDDDAYSLRVIERVAGRQGKRIRSDVPGLVFLEIDGLAAPVLRRAMRDGNAPVLARWMADGTHHLLEWETDLSSQTGASQAGILLGSNEDIPAFRWVEKETGKLMTCSAPADCAEIERRLANGRGLLAGGGASRGNLLSGEADEVILTVSRMDAEKRANAGYRAFLANGFNVTRELVLFAWEVALEYSAAIRQRRRRVIPRGERGGRYPYLRAALCVVVRDLIVYGVLGDMMRGRPAVYATFSSYDEVAHHSGLERVDTLEALRKLDQQFGRIERARQFAPRPYKLVVLSDHGQTQGQTFKQRNGYGLDELVQRSLERGTVSGVSGGDEHDDAVGQALQEATASGAPARSADAVGDSHAVVLGSGNLGLVYLMEEGRRLTAEEIEQRHPRLLSALGEHPDIGWLLVRSAEHGPLAMTSRGVHYLAEHRIEGTDPLAPFSPNAPAHLLRTDGFAHVADIMIGSFYNPELEQGCAFEELISFHGGLGGPQTRPFLLCPAELPIPSEPIVGAAHVHELLIGWRRLLEDTSRRTATDEPVSALS